MRSGLSWVLGAWLFAALPVFAQSPPSPEIPGTPSLPDSKGTPDTSDSKMPADAVDPAPAPDNFRFWARGEYLALWVKNSPLPVSLVTGDPNNPAQELLNSDRSFGMFSGFRIGFGGWLDPYNNLALETSFFDVQRRTRSFAASSDAVGNPILAFPFTNQTPGAVGDTLLPITSPGQFAGNVLVASTLQLWGAEANGALALVTQGNFEFIGLVGVRYADLRETLSISTVSSDILTDPNTVLSQSDSFNTRNQFYGGQIGGRLNWQGERFALGVTGKLALGATHQTVDVQGFSTQTGPGGVNGTFPGGFFTQTSNMGRSSSNQFTVMPSLEMKLYLILTANLRAFVGYDFLYWNSVVRPGSQIDRNINLSQSAIFGNGALSGPAFPMPLLSRTDFWAQGVTLGLELRF